MEAEWLTADDAADILHVERDAVRKWAIKGLLPGAYKKERWYIPRSSVEEFKRTHQYDWIRRKNGQGKEFSEGELDNYRRICREYFTHLCDSRYRHYMEAQSMAAWYALMGSGCVAETADEAIDRVYLEAKEEAEAIGKEGT